MNGYELEDLPAEEIERLTERATALAESVRGLIQTTVVTEVGDADLDEAIAHIRAAQLLLSRKTLPGSFGVRFNSDGTRRTWGNAVTGTRNPVAPPVVLAHDGDRTWSEVTMGPAYEGPPGLVHGGVLAAILDQVLGSAAEHAGAPGMTGTLTVRYRHGTPLGPIRAEAWLDRREGVKTFTMGRIIAAGAVTAEAEGVFILPRWARGAAAESLRPGVGDA